MKTQLRGTVMALDWCILASFWGNWMEFTNHFKYFVARVVWYQKWFGAVPFPATNVGESLTNIPWNRGKWWWVKPCGILFQRQVARGPKPPVRPGRSCVVFKSFQLCLGLGLLMFVARSTRSKGWKWREPNRRKTMVNHVVPRFLTGWRIGYD